MSTTSKIEWTDATWNPTRGCAKVSEGCRNCYAMRQAIRQSGPGGAYEGLVHTVPGKGPQWTGRVQIVPELAKLPLRWRKPRRIFVDSMSDLFHPDVPVGFIDEIWATMSMTPRHTYQILTKRPERAAEIIPALAGRHRPPDGSRWPLPNVWIGTSVEDQAAADERIPHLLRAPAAVRFLSCEPLIGPVSLRREWLRCPGGAEYGHGFSATTVHAGGCCMSHPRVHWVISGGESGPGARPCGIHWHRVLRDQCRANGVAFFLKQLGARPTFPHSGNTLDLKDRKGGDIERWPEDLRVREFPA